MMEPTKDDVILDPSCGTAGFLVAAGEYYHENHKDWFHEKGFRTKYNNEKFVGVEFDPTMLRIGAMNLQLHGIENPVLIAKDALSEGNADLKNKVTLVLANPPFKGSLDYDGVEKSLLQTVKTKKTELLFLALMLRALKTGGRCAVIVPDGVLFGSSNAHKQIREEIIANNRLEGVISMPSGVFKPYAGVSTAILIFTKTGNGGTDKVWFYDMQADGLSLDDKRQTIEANDIPDIIKRWKNRSKETKRSKAEKSFLVSFDEIKSNNWDLSINRYIEVIHEEIIYDKPSKIIKEIEQLDNERVKVLKRLKTLID
ncbi:MAG: Type restriction-modification system, DNA-methyltransferase subunit [Cytophagaceae bacterium]|nr:Type restriction-modification system, DNA-methyltransferase subunit [Cytophagaceae bacterium]